MYLFKLAMYITTYGAVSWILACGEVYSKQYYVIKLSTWNPSDVPALNPVLDENVAAASKVNRVQSRW